MAALTRRIACLIVALALVTGCASLPRDPDGTLERVRATGVLRAGASLSPGFIVVDGDAVAGPEADLVTGFAEAQGVRVEWHPGGEEGLVRAMEEGEIDILAGGLTAESPWADRVSLTRPYATGERHGHEVDQVLAVPLGENAMLVAVETYLDERRP